MTIPFWTNEPTILFDKSYILELWVNSSMCYEQKLNAISRLIILLTILGYRARLFVLEIIVRDTILITSVLRNY